MTRNPWLWLLTCVATYWFLMIGLVEQNGRALAPLWVTNSLAIFSTIVELWGRFSLGRNIGFVPAQREVVTRGAYKYVRHPIYAGLFIWIVGYWLSGYSPRNTLLYALAIFWFAIKSVVEERFLRADPGYAAYMERVRWRWIPIPFLARVNSRTARTNAAFLIALCLLTSTSAQTNADEETAKQVAAKTIRADAVRAHMRFLSDSLLKGRDPGSPEYEIAAHYVAAQLEAIGVQPAGDHDTWFQQVPFLKATPDDSKSLIVFANGKQEVALKDLEDFMFYADVAHTDSSVEASVVFVGYGITAPELKYDDYAGTDVKGKIVASISNAPPTFSASQAAYYANETGKARNAAAHGAIGRLEFYLPGETVDLSGAGQWLDSEGIPNDAVPEILVWGWLTPAGARKLFTGSTKSLDRAIAAARTGQPQSFPLAWNARIHAVNTHQRLAASNVVGKIAGSDPTLRDQYVIYSAHIDHMGICSPVEGSSDNVCHGALDNASGVATVLEIARAYAALPVAPRRSVVFLFTTGEEDNFEGADYFAHFPTIPSKGMIADINIDVVPGMRYPCKDLLALGGELSSLLKNAESAARKTGYTISRDPFPQRNYFARNDEYAFALQGVPAIMLRNGTDGDEVLAKWTTTRYHRPLDNIDQPIDYEAGLRAAVTNFLLGYEVAQQDQSPKWNENDFLGAKFEKLPPGR